MQRLIHAFSWRRRGRPAPIWRAQAYRPTIDIRLADIHEGITDDRRGQAGEGAPVPRMPRREIWEL